MAATDFIAAIELGSAKITGIAGKKNADGSIQVLAYASVRSSDCIKKGAIYNLDKTTQCLLSVVPSAAPWYFVLPKPAPYRVQWRLPDRISPASASYLVLRVYPQPSWRRGK